MRTHAGRWLPLLMICIWASASPLVWGAVLPVGEAPDESTHIDIVRFIAAEHRTPVLGIDKGFGVTIVFAENSSKQSEPWRYPYLSMAGQPGGHYWIASLVAPNNLSNTTGASTQLLRAPGAVYAALLAIATYFLVWLLVGGGARREANGVSLACALMVASWPQIVYLFSYVNTDGFTVLAATLSLLGLAWGVSSRWSARSALLAGGALGMLSVGKMTGFIVLGVIAVVAIVSAVSMKRGLRAIPLALVGALGSGGWWWYGAVQRYGAADPLGYGWAHKEFEKLDAVLPSARNLGMTFTEMLTQSRFFPKLIAGSFGMFQKQSTLHPVLFAGPLLLAILAVVLVVRFRGQLLAQLRRPIQLVTTPAGAVGLSIGLGGILQLIFVAYICYFNEFQPQGRYLTPLIPGALAMIAVVIVRNGAPIRPIAVFVLAAILCQSAVIAGTFGALASSVGLSAAEVLSGVAPAAWLAWSGAAIVSAAVVVRAITIDRRSAVGNA